MSNVYTKEALDTDNMFIYIYKYLQKRYIHKRSERQREIKIEREIESMILNTRRDIMKYKCVFAYY